MTVPRRQSSHHRAWSVSNAARSLRPCVAISSPCYSHLRKSNKRALQCARCPTTLKPACSFITHAHIPSPHWRQRRKCHNDVVEITLKKQASLASIRLRAVVMASTGIRAATIQVTSRQYGRRAIYVSGDVRFQDGDAFDLGKLGGGTFYFILFHFLSMSALVLAYSAIRYTYRTTVVLWHNGPCDIGVVSKYYASQCAWRISPLRFNNVRLSSLIFTPTMSGLLCRRVLKPRHYQRLS